MLPPLFMDTKLLNYFVKKKIINNSMQGISRHPAKDPLNFAYKVEAQRVRKNINNSVRGGFFKTPRYNQ